jgi:membrane protease YdiL (CAAX protease family)
MALAVGLFEAIFFRGWLQLRFENAFGSVPGLVLGALCYSLYHIGYGMNFDELLFLFGLGRLLPLDKEHFRFVLYTHRWIVHQFE